MECLARHAGTVVKLGYSRRPLRFVRLTLSLTALTAASSACKDIRTREQSKLGRTMETTVKTSLSLALARTTIRRQVRPHELYTGSR